MTPTASKLSDGSVEQANKAGEGMAQTIVSCFESWYEIDVATGHPVVQWAIRHAAWLLERFPTW